MSIIQIKRGENSNLSSLVLSPGEPAFTLDTGKLYIGNGNLNVLINPTLGTAAMANTGTSSGNVPVLDSNGKLASSVIPPIAISETFVVNSQEAMLSLGAEVGDIAIRTDISQTFILQNMPPSILSNWLQLLFPIPVSSVNSLTGNVVLTGANINLSGYTIATIPASIVATDSINQAFGKIEYTLGLKSNTISPNFTGIPTAPTAIPGTNTTQIATTAFVHTAVSVIDGGTF